MGRCFSKISKDTNKNKLKPLNISNPRKITPLNNLEPNNHSRIKKLRKADKNIQVNLLPPPPKPIIQFDLLPAKFFPNEKESRNLSHIFNRTASPVHNFSSHKGESFIYKGDNRSKKLSEVEASPILSNYKLVERKTKTPCRVEQQAQRINNKKKHKFSSPGARPLSFGNKNFSNFHKSVTTGQMHKFGENKKKNQISKQATVFKFPEEEGEDDQMKFMRLQDNISQSSSELNDNNTMMKAFCEEYEEQFEKINMSIANLKDGVFKF